MSANAATAAEQLRRLLLVLPTLADDAAHSIGEIAARVGAPEDVIVRDLRELITRTADEPGGFTEGVSLLLGRDTVQLQTPAGHFRRPMALTRTELHALELGLTMLALEAPRDEQGVLERARTRLRKAIAGAPSESIPAEARVAALAPESPATQAMRRTLQRCIRERRVAMLTYRSASATADEERDVQPLGLVWSRGHWYLVAWCRRSDGLRVFRFDRITAARASDEHFDSIDGFQLDAALRNGRVLSGDDAGTVQIWYSPRIARWIHEREGGSLAADGSLTVEYELHDPAWAVRHVLRYGPDARIIAPQELRQVLRATLTAVMENQTSDER